MKQSIISAAVSVLALVASSAFAEGDEVQTDGPYISVWGGLSVPGAITGQYYGSTTVELNSKTGYTLGGAIGRTLWNDNVRGEFELSHQKNDIEDAAVGWNDNEDCTDQTCRAGGSSSTTYLMGNLWFDMPMGESFTPYAGGGVGMALFKPAIYGEGKSNGLFDTPDDVFDGLSLGAAGQVGLGVRSSLTDTVALDLGYRLRGLTGLSVNNEIDGNNSCNPCSLSSGWTYSHTLQVGLTVELQ